MSRPTIGAPTSDLAQESPDLNDREWGTLTAIAGFLQMDRWKLAVALAEAGWHNGDYVPYRHVVDAGHVRSKEIPGREGQEAYTLYLWKRSEAIEALKKLGVLGGRPRLEDFHQAAREIQAMAASLQELMPALDLDLTLEADLLDFAKRLIGDSDRLAGHDRLLGGRVREVQALLDRHWPEPGTAPDHLIQFAADLANVDDEVAIMAERLVQAKRERDRAAAAAKSRKQASRPLPGPPKPKTIDPKTREENEAWLWQKFAELEAERPKPHARPAHLKLEHLMAARASLEQVPHIRTTFTDDEE